MSASPERDEAAEQPKKITFRFCRECSNMLYPRDDDAEQRLMFACRTCQYSEPATSSCIFRNDLSTTVGDTAGITQDVSQDPTLPRTVKPCPSCNENDAVFFQSQQRTAETTMKNYYVCCSCGHVWQ
ncbi:DNA-directed RNA polymeras-like protein II subunit rpb9 [Aulographum hederae CBS 113979]|uniref:DNA-directed RNA polymerase subunit n=1 Tax=Aulographum hederae CBS 113979 TaxID=1176131 RepID=A0A6G1H095_9PEZI|nr:DNA-directed RNA polymeras-like protein II subunit rpb9 [Aulographum hederae CBS 113979]